MSQNILVLGAGELGTQVLVSLSHQPPERGTHQTQCPAAPLQHHLVALIPGDIEHDTPDKLAEILSPFDTVISCTGFVAGKGTQVKITRAVLAAGVERYIPWQFGVDYDVIGRGSGHELFDEQLDVRHLLRSQDRTRWAIISTGMFMSFLFERVFGVVDLDRGEVCALGSWENSVTVTTVEDVGAATAEVVLGHHSDDNFSDAPIYIGGDTISYERLAELVESVTGRAFKRSCLTVEGVKRELAKDPGNALKKYQLVFGNGRGVAWDLEETWNSKKGMRLVTVEEWARRNLM